MDQTSKETVHLNKSGTLEEGLERMATIAMSYAAHQQYTQIEAKGLMRIACTFLCAFIGTGYHEELTTLMWQIIEKVAEDYKIEP